MTGRWIVAGLLLGAVAGETARMASPDAARWVAEGGSLLSVLFLRLVRMVVAPLVFATVAAALAGLGGDARGAGRLFGRAMLWFAGASILSMAIGWGLADLLEPGAALHLVVPDRVAEAGPPIAGPPIAGPLAASPPTASPPTASLPGPREMLLRVVPDSVVGAMARNEILPVTVFAALFGTAAGGLPAPARERTGVLLGDLARVMLRMTALVMRLAPVGVFGAMAAVLAGHGIGVLGAYGRFAGGVALGLGLLWAALIGMGALVLGRGPAVRLAGELRGPMALAFATASGEAAYPRLLERLLAWGVPERVAGFVLPLGYCFNLDGAALYLGLAAPFVAQAYGVAMTPAQQLGMGLTLLVAAKGTAGVPRAAIAVLATVLPQWGLPEAGIGLLLAVDPILDMGRSATNTLGNGIAAAAVGRWEEARGFAPGLAPSAAGGREG